MAIVTASVNFTGSCTGTIQAATFTSTSFSTRVIQDPWNDAGLDATIRMMIAIGNTFTLAKAKELQIAMRSYQADLLAYLTVLNSRTRLIMHTMGQMQQKTLLQEILAAQVSEITTSQIASVGVVKINQIVASAALAANDIKSSLELSNGLASGTLNVYSPAENEGGINWSVSAATNPDAMLYYATKQLVGMLGRITRHYSSYQAINDDLREAQVENMCVRPDILLNQLAEQMRLLLQSVKDSDHFIDACSLLAQIYSANNLTTRQTAIDFLKNKYEIIKASALSVILGQT